MRIRRVHLLSTLLHLRTSLAREPQQRLALAFLTPSVADASQFSVGEDIGIRWQTPFEFTTLEVWQGPKEDGSFAMQTLIANASRSLQMHTFTAAPLSHLPLTIPFHFRLQKGDQPNLCTGCTAESPKVYLSTATQQTKDDDSGGNFGSAGPDLTKAGVVGVGIGLGVGAVAVMLFIGLLVCIDRQHRRSKRKRRRDRERKGRHPLESSSRGRRRLRLDRERQIQREQERRRLHSSWADTIASSTSGRPKSDLESFEFEDLDGTARDGWYELMSDGKWKPSSRKMEEAHTKEKSVDQTSFASASTKAPEGYERTDRTEEIRYELQGCDVEIMRPERSLRLSRF